MSTVALNLIVKDEFDEVSALLDKALGAFDQIVVVVSDRSTYESLKRIDYRGLDYAPTFYYRKWNDRFDDARNFALSKTKTDYFFWVDADDSFDFRAIPQLVSIADENNIDAIFLPYNYAHDEDGNVITRHWRERLLRTGKGFEWRGWVHETCISDEPYTSHKVDAPVTHNTGDLHAKKSMTRNHIILDKAYAATGDPRYLIYLGMSHFSLGDYEKAALLLSDYLEVGGSVEDTYRALSVISECAYHLKKLEMALEFATKTIVLKPEYPMGYWLLAQYEADQSNWKEALEWVRVSEGKPDPDTLSVYDPSARERARLIGAQAEFMLGNYNAALVWLRKIPNNKTALSLFEDFQKEADAETFTQLLPKIVPYFHNIQSLYESLCDDMRYDSRLKSLRNAATTPTTWSDNSVVIFCGQGYEEWGPHTADKGMGGSEEAVLYLAPKLQELGYDVTVYGEVPSNINLNMDTQGVIWRPWKEIDTRDKFNVFISWRAPQYLERVNAKVKLCDVHDVLPNAIVKDYPDVTYLVKSQYHRDLYPELPDDKFVIIGNGISKEQFRD